MTTKLEQAARQALEALEVYEIKLNSRLCNEAITALREALANTRSSIRSSIRSTSEYSEQAEQEPFAWMHPSGGCLSAHYMKEFATGLEKETHTIPLYASPVRTKDLTDDELLNELKLLDASTARLPIGFKLFARAVIAAYKEKNK